MIKRTDIAILLLLVALTVVVGCSRQERPDGLPKLYPCKITLAQGGAPAADVRISFVDETVSRKWTISGVTDAQGVAKIQTHGQFDGAPSGKFKLVLSKTVSEGGIEGDETSSAVKRTETRIYSLVDPKFVDAGTTPLEIEIVNGSVAETFDLGPAARELIETIAPDGV